MTDVSYHGIGTITFFGFALGALAMSFVEYGVHRWMFHNPKVYRAEHWVHHIRPTDYVGVPSWQSNLALILLLITMWGSCGLDFGSGFFIGFACYYLAYIMSHDGFHHGRFGLNSPGYWHRRRVAHLMHHAKGVELNFGVASPIWDMLLGTYSPPRKAFPPF